MTQREYCEKRGVAVRSLQSWLRRHRENPAPKAGFFEVMRPVSGTGTAQCDYEVVFGGHGALRVQSLKIDGGFNPEDLRQLLGVLGESVGARG